MLIKFIFHVGFFTLFYALVMLATMPFLVYFGQPKPWQKLIEFLLAFPLDAQKLGFFDFIGGALIVLLNGVLWGIVVVGTERLLIWVAGRF